MFFRWIIYLAAWGWAIKTALYSEACEEWFNSLHPFVVVALLLGLVIAFVMGVGAFVAGNDPETQRIIDEMHAQQKSGKPVNTQRACQEIRRTVRTFQGK